MHAIDHTKEIQTHTSNDDFSVVLILRLVNYTTEYIYTC